MLANLSGALFERKHIMTTEAKAKETRRFSERLITMARKDTIHARRTALAKLRHKRIVKILFDEIAPEYRDRPGGYTRVIKLGQRAGDGSRMAILELVGFEAASKKKKAKDKEKEAASEQKKKKKTREKEQPAAETDSGKKQDAGIAVASGPGKEESKKTGSEKKKKELKKSRKAEEKETESKETTKTRKKKFGK